VWFVTTKFVCEKERGQASFWILPKNPKNASTALSMNGKFPMISHAPPFVPSINSGETLRLRMNGGLFSRIFLVSGNWKSSLSLLSPSLSATKPLTRRRGSEISSEIRKGSAVWA
jgi:hypothetical protein